jgi:hypothetical protein
MVELTLSEAMRGGGRGVWAVANVKTCLRKRCEEFFCCGKEDNLVAYFLKHI